MFTFLGSQCIYMWGRNVTRHLVQVFEIDQSVHPLCGKCPCIDFRYGGTMQAGHCAVPYTDPIVAGFTSK